MSHTTSNKEILAPAPGPAPPDNNPESWGYDLLLYGHEQILRGSDNGTLVALGALAYQQLRDETEAHQHVGCGFVLFSVLMCALVHLAMGNAYIGRARRIIRGEMEKRRGRGSRKFSVGLALIAALLQCLFLIIGLVLILTNRPPAFLQNYLLSWFG
jgi:hypothetical protein